MEGEKRKLIKFSNYSLCVTLPKWVIKKLNWKKGDVVNLDIDDNSGEIIVSKGHRISRSKELKSKAKTKRVDQLRW